MKHPTGNSIKNAHLSSISDAENSNILSSITIFYLIFHSIPTKSIARYPIKVIGRSITCHYRYTSTKKYHKHSLASGFWPKFNSTPFLRTRSSRKPIFFTFPRRQIYTPPYGVARLVRQGGCVNY